MNVVIKFGEWLELNNKLGKLMEALKNNKKDKDLLRQIELVKHRLEELNIYKCNHILVETKERIYGDMYDKWFYKTECVKCGLSDEWGYEYSYYLFKDLRATGKLKDYKIFPNGEYHNLESIREKYLEALSIAANPLDRDEIVRIIIEEVEEEKAMVRQRVNQTGL